MTQVHGLVNLLKDEKMDHADALKELAKGRPVSPKKVIENAKERTAQEQNSVMTQQIVDLRQQLTLVEDHNNQLRDTMREMVEDYSRQLELRDTSIREL